MSSALLFGAGAFITFITLWGVVMAGGLHAIRRQPPDDDIVDAVPVDGHRIGSVVVSAARAADPPIRAPVPAA